VFWILLGAFITLSSGLLSLKIVQTFLQYLFPNIANTHVEYVKIGLVIFGVVILLRNAFSSRRTNKGLRSMLSTTQEELESTKKELYKIQQQQQPRTLSLDQVQRFQTFLREVPGCFILIESPAGDREAERLALQLISILKSEGWAAGNSDTLVYFNLPIEGIIIRVRNLDSAQPHVSILQRAFEAIGMPAKIEVDDTSLQPPIQLCVGHKPSS